MVYTRQVKARIAGAEIAELYQSSIFKISSKVGLEINYSTGGTPYNVTALLKSFRVFEAAKVRVRGLHNSDQRDLPPSEFRGSGAVVRGKTTRISLADLTQQYIPTNNQTEFLHLDFLLEYLITRRQSPKNVVAQLPRRFPAAYLSGKQPNLPAWNYLVVSTPKPKKTS